MDYGILFAAEFVGTMLLILLGNGVGYNLIGKKTFGANTGWLMGSIGWGLAVMVGAYASSAIANGAAGSAALNPAVSIAQMIMKDGRLDPGLGFIAIAAQLAGAFVGQVVLNVFNNRVLMQIKHDAFGAHSCSPAYAEKNVPTNLFVEFVATGVLIVIAVYAMSQLTSGAIGDIKPVLKMIQPFLVGMLILSIAVSLGGLTGYAINPARDAMPRVVYMITHKLLKFDGSAVKAANWKYGWIPVVGPLGAGAIIGGFLAI